MIPLIQSLQSIAILARHLEERHSPVVSCYTTPCSQLTPSDITCLASVASSCDRYLPPLRAVSTAKNEYVQLLLSYVRSSKPQNRIRLYAYASKTGLVSCDHLANSCFINNEPETLRLIKLENWLLFLNETSKGHRDMVINANITR